MPRIAEYRAPVLSPAKGVITKIDNRLISRIAKLAGAPRAQAAGIELHVRVGHAVERGQPLMTIHAESPANSRMPWPTTRVTRGRSYFSTDPLGAGQRIRKTTRA